MSIKSPKKLIEVALPLDDINEEAALRKRKAPAGYPTALHKWWAQRPPAAARAVLFAQMVNDPGGERGYYSGKTKEQADQEREALFQIIRDLVKWENTNNEVVLERARAEIRKSWRETCELNRGRPGFDPEKLPAFHDPFAGSGAIPLEAQRLGLETYASDLNPVAVLINKAMIEIPPKFAGRKPVGSISACKIQQKMHEDWSGSRGLAEDVRRYGHWINQQAEHRIGHLYPKVKVTEAMASARSDLKPYIGEELTVIAWLWVRTVKSPNPAYSQVDVPLASNFVLSSKDGKEAWVEPVVEGSQYRFTVRIGKPPAEAKDGTKLARGAKFRCVMSDAPIEENHIYNEANAGRMGARLMAIVAEGTRGRLYLDPTVDAEAIAAQAKPTWKPEVAMPENPRWFSPPLYGLKTYGDLFTPRQLVALTTFSDLVTEARGKIIADALAAGMPDDGQGLDAGGTGATAYGDAVSTYLMFVQTRLVHYSSTICTWLVKDAAIARTFTKQAIPMAWDFAEGNPFGKSSTEFSRCTEVIAQVVEKLAASRPATAWQDDATTVSIPGNAFVSTDPPYYDNIGYADLSDFFYLWLRRGLKEIFPKMLSTVSTPKADELVATPYRHGGKVGAEVFFMRGMSAAMQNIATNAPQTIPTTIYYAFKQSETKGANTKSTGWEKFLEAVLAAGFHVTGTWPLRTEGDNRQVGIGTNALASSILIVCRKREVTSESISRREFQRELREQMPGALEP